MASKLSFFVSELKRRKVTGVAVLYVVVGFGVIEGADIILPRLSFPDWAVDFVLWVVLLGFPVALILSWFIEIAPDGIRRTPDLTPDQLAHQAPVKWSPRSWAFIGAGSFLVLVIALLGVPRTSAIAFNARDWILLADLENNTGDEVFDRSLIHALTVSLDQSLFINVFRLFICLRPWPVRGG